MKTKNFIITICLILVSMLIGNMLIAQDINGKLGTGGQFIIRDTTTTFLTLSQSTGDLSLNRSLNLPYTTNSSLGIIFKDGVRFLHNYGTNNTFMGINSGNFTMTGAWNSAFGLRSLLSNTTGYENTGLGAQSLNFNTTGYNNTAVGVNSLYTNPNGYENTAIGHSSLFFNTTGSDNTAVGVNSLYSNTTGFRNTALGHEALSFNTTGNGNIAIGWNAQPPSGIGNNQVRIGNTNINYAGIQVAWTITSDKRWKSDIQNSNLGLSFISKLKPVSYFRTNDENKKTEYGFIAQDIEEVLKEQGVDNSGMLTITDDGMYELRYNDLLAPMVKAIQELKVENEQLKTEISELKEVKDKITVLEKMINDLKSSEKDIKEIKLTEK